ncbi:DUF1190 domain-containing protein [Methylobacterium haplocladii]|uniref:DUF1190 domain-containing protein n=1 Tax=Methylobacterium haplocladii TaxID=1176176 RepID=A0A512ITM0_9HYPH|nr:DUF1190 domain-containing protein [Methylobacterium haplocladii]GEP00989.1 hypothetical protein MHA02_33760 [Methylobacterium haplocladii]GLS58335.1 hypothetical protein GCM10007887_09940 [Methylobacterium haplocladii]
MKRSRTVSLVLLAGAGVAAFGFAHFDPSQDEEDVRFYAGPSDCIDARLRSSAECLSEYETARALYPTAAPRYASSGTCEAHHGLGRCVTGESVTEAARGQYLPLMAGYMIGLTADQNLPPQPVYDHAPQGEALSGGGPGGAGYCTGSGARIWTVGGGRSSAARVSSAALRGSSFGGFGGTGRSFSSSSRGGFGGG